MKHDTQTPQRYDVIILYNGLMAHSALDTTYRGHSPFSKKEGYEKQNNSYAYFLQQCKKEGLRAAFSTTTDVSTNGVCDSVWIYDTRWRREKKPAHATIFFDKFSHQRNNGIAATLLKKNLRTSHMFHSARIRTLFDNKMKTFSLFSQYSIPTVSIDIQSRTQIAAAQKKLKTQIRGHIYANDFSTDCVLKDQFGAGGALVFKTNAHTNYRSISTSNDATSFILQPFITASGFHFGKYTGTTDLRVILSNGRIVQSYIRISKKNEFRANASQGGNVVYIDPHRLPADVIEMATAIHKRLNIAHSFYSLDFMKSHNGHLYFIEGNITPGLNWFNRSDEIHAKKLIRLLVKEMKRTTHSVA